MRPAGRAPSPGLTTGLAGARLPVSFQPNLGQAPERIQFLSQAAGFTLGLTASGFELIGPTKGPIRISARGGRPNVALRVEAEQLGISNFLVGNDPSRWRTGIPNYARVRYPDIFPGIDWLVYGNSGTLEYDFIVTAGADPGTIRLDVDGGDALSIDDDGDLLIGDETKPLRMVRPVAYQDSAGRRRPVAASYALDPDRRTISFTVGKYDPSLPLVIDPMLVYSTYFGGSGDWYWYRADGDAIADMAIDAEGNVYIVGTSWSFNDTPTVNALQSENNAFAEASTNAFVAKLSADGMSLIFSTYLGGSSCQELGEHGTALALDASGNVYVTGSTYSTDFPTTTGALKEAKPTCVFNAFVSKIDSTGSSLVYSTYLGANGTPDGGGDAGTAIAVDASGSAYVAGVAYTNDFPTVNAFQTVNKGFANHSVNSFISKLSPAGDALIYSTYLGGTTTPGLWDQIVDIAVDGAGNAYVVGSAASADFPVVNPIQAVNRATQGSSGSHQNAFVTKLNPQGNALVFSTYLGGTGNGFAHGDYAHAITFDPDGNPWVTGGTASNDFPVSPDARQGQNLAYPNEGFNAFLSKIDPSGSQLLYSTYFGGTESDAAQDLAIDAAGKVYLTGVASSEDFPVLNPVAGTLNGSLNVGPYVAVFTNAGDLIYSTIFAGSFGSRDPRIAVDGDGITYLAGTTTAQDFPTVNPYQAQNNAAGSFAFNGFIAKLSAAPDEPPPSPPQQVVATGQDGSVQLSWSAVAEAASYNVYQADSAGAYQGPAVAGVTDTTVDITGLSNGTQYSFRISSVSVNGEGLKSAAISAMPALPAPPPPPPSSTSGSGGGGVVPTDLLVMVTLVLWRRGRRPCGATLH
jgi:hypothetical protein